MGVDEGGGGSDVLMPVFGLPFAVFLGVVLVVELGEGNLDELT